jgi:hypothetical protein
LLSRECLGVRKELVVEVKGSLHACIIQISVPNAQAPAGCRGCSGVESAKALVLMPNVRAKPTAEAGAVSPNRDDSTNSAARAYSACRSGSV